MRARLHPSGAVRVALGIDGARDPFESFRAMRDALGDEALAAAWELARLVPEESGAREAVLALAGALLWNDAQGSTRLPLGDEGSGPLHDVLRVLGVAAELELRVRSLALARGEGSPAAVLFGRRGEYRPFIVDGAALALERRARLEGSLAGLLRDRLRAEPASCPASAEEALRDLQSRPPRVGDRPTELSVEQRWAVVASAFQRLTLISGGPGTGKTSVIVSILRLVARLGVDPVGVALAAPTGKAAHRMEEAIERSLRGIAEPAPADRLLERRAAPTTLHRLLGYSPRRGTFAHHAQNPLPHEVVIVDEASMIDVGLMDHLARAVAPEARLILLGDAEQLPSVDAGAVLRDLVPAHPRRTPRAWDPLTPTPGVEVGESSDLRDRAAVRLSHSYRADAADPAGRAILEASRGVRAGHRPATERRTTSAEVAFRGVELLDASAAERSAFLARWYAVHFGRVGLAKLARDVYALDGQGSLAAGDVEKLARLDALLQSARVLCLYRSDRDDAGVAGVNRALGALHADLLADEAADRGDPLQPGTPLLMTQNDHALGLFNGDVGVVIRAQGPDDEGPRTRLAFSARGSYRLFEPGGLEARAEPAWAMTVHKAQGSELDSVALMLPRDEGLEGAGEARSLLSREVVYTALTRARRSVVIVSSEAVLREAVERTLPRYSGLSDPSVWAA